MIPAIAGLTTILLFAGAILRDREGVAVAVLPFETTGIDKRLETVVTNTIRGVITKNKHNLLRDDRIREILKDKGLKAEGCATPECGVKLGEILKVDAVIIGEILLRGDEVYIHSAIIDVKARAEKKASQAVLKNSDNIMPFSLQAEKIGNELMGRKSWNSFKIKKNHLLVAGSVASVVGAGWYYNEKNKPNEGGVEIIVEFPR